MNLAGFIRWTRVCLFLALLGCVWTQVPSAVLAEGKVTMQVTAGIGGDYKEAQLVPLRVTVVNSGSDIEGDVLVESSEGGMVAATFHQKVSLAAGATKQVTLLVPGQNIHSGLKVYFKQGEKEIASANIGGRRHSPDTLFVGVVAADPDTANFLSALPKQKFQDPVRVIPMKPEEIPETASALSMMGVLVFNNIALDGVTPKQIQAIHDWTRQGGLLVLAGGASYDKAARAFQDLSPVDVSGTTAVSSLAGLAVDKNQPLSLQKPFTISKAAVKTGKVLFSESSHPLFVARQANQGSVLFVSYDLAEEPLASWSGNGPLWADVLQKTVGSKRSVDIMEDTWPLREASQRIPTLALPNVVTLAVCFAAYALVAGPVLYYVLKRRRKQEYIWVIVPALAFCTGFGIYGFGAVKRGNEIIVHNVAFVDVQSDDYARINAVSSVLLPRGGDFQLRFKGGETILPLQNDYRYDEQAAKKTWVSVTGNQAEVEFRNVEFWSMRSTLAKKTELGVGKFASNLVVQDGKLTGTVTNRTKYPLQDAKVVLGRHVFDLGELAAGATAQVNLSLNAASVAPDRYRLPRQALLPQEVRQMKSFESSREMFVLDILDRGTGSVLPEKMGPVVLLGWTEQPLLDMEIDGEGHETHNLALVKGELEIKPAADGSVFYPAGAFPAAVLDRSVKTDEMEDGFFMQAGDITFEFAIADESRPFQATKVYMYTWSQDRTPFDKQVYNWKTNTYDPFDRAFPNNTLAGEKIAEYLSPEGKLRLKMSHSQPEHRHVGKPVISVEGKVIRP